MEIWKILIYLLIYPFLTYALFLKNEDWDLEYNWGFLYYIFWVVWALLLIPSILFYIELLTSKV